MTVSDREKAGVFPRFAQLTTLMPPGAVSPDSANAHNAPEAR